MPNTVAEYYADELIDWNRLVSFYRNELGEFELKLGEVIQRNTIPNIAAKVEEQQNRLNAITERFYKLQVLIQKQQAVLRTDSTLIEDALINTETEKKQNELRSNMQQVEKEYVDTKYACYDFLSRVFRKKSD